MVNETENITEIVICLKFSDVLSLYFASGVYCLLVRVVGILRRSRLATTTPRRCGANRLNERSRGKVEDVLHTTSATLTRLPASIIRIVK